MWLGGEKADHKNNLLNKQQGGFRAQRAPRGTITGARRGAITLHGLRRKKTIERREEEVTPGGKGKGHNCMGRLKTFEKRKGPCKVAEGIEKGTWEKVPRGGLDGGVGTGHKETKRHSEIPKDNNNIRGRCPLGLDLGNWRVLSSQTPE